MLTLLRKRPLRNRDTLDEPGDWFGKKAQSAHGTETLALEEREIDGSDGAYRSACVRWRIWIGTREDGQCSKLTQRVVGYGF